MRFPALLLLFVVAIAGCSSGSSGDADANQPGVILLRYAPGSESTEQREEGFLDTLEKEYPDVHILSSNQYAMTTPESAFNKAQTLLAQHRDNTQAIFCVCEPVATGALRALEELDLDGKVYFVGFDSTETMVRAMKEGKMAGIVLQDPVMMGYKAVMTMHQHLEGQPVEKRISTGEFIATPENMEDPRIAELLAPEQFSGEEFKPASTKYVIAVIPKGTTHEFWKSVHAGASNAARELGDVEIRWQGPLQENDREGQIQVVQSFTSSGVDGICLAPLDSQALLESVRQAKEKGIPTVIFDSNLDDKGELKVSYVATDNHAGGALAARRIAELVLGEKKAGESSEAVASTATE